MNYRHPFHQWNGRH